ncbi:MAG: 4'-phosphopantetheinyl transferase superfamily protein [Elusimicrobiota bacterium]
MHFNITPWDNSAYRPHFILGYIKDFNKAELLNEDEKKDYEKLKVPKRKKEWLSARVCAKKLISSVTAIDVSEIAINNDPDRKPYAFIKKYDKKFYISISHRNDMVGAAFNDNLDPYVGIDIEFVEDINKKALADFMTEKELSLNIEGIIRSWSLKEAFLKLIGKGLTADLKDMEFDGINFTVKGKTFDVLTSLKICKIYYYTFKNGNYIISLCWSGGLDGRK